MRNKPRASNGMSADDVFFWANWLLVGALILGVLATGAIVVSGNIRDRELKRELKEKDESIANANAQTKEAELKLEELRREVGPRRINREVFQKAIEGDIKAPVEILYLRDDPECFDVAQQIWQLLRDAKWDAKAPRPIPLSNSGDALSLPTSMSVSGQPSGVTVATHSISKEELQASIDRMMGNGWTKTPYTVLQHAIGEALGQVKSWASGPNPPAPGTLRIVVAPR